MKSESSKIFTKFKEKKSKSAFICVTTSRPAFREEAS